MDCIRGQCLAASQGSCLHAGSARHQKDVRAQKPMEIMLLLLPPLLFICRGASGCYNCHGYCKVGYHVNLFTNPDEQTAD